MVKLAIDIMGGDFAPLAIIDGVKLALNQFDDLEFVLFGDEEIIKKHLPSHPRVVVVHAPDKIDMGEKDPIGEIRRNRNTSLVKAFQAVKNKEVDGAVTAGPTQGTIAAAHLIIRRIPGMKRVALCPILPNLGGKHRLLLDVGANLELRSEHLLQIAQYASIFIKEVWNIDKPIVGLMNIGTEPGKGRELERETFDILQKDENITFAGNIEGKEIFSTSCDILITDGFTGNMIMKTSEGVAKAVGVFLKQEIKKNLRSKLGYLFLKPVFKNFKKILSPDEVGGAHLFGVDGVVVKAHGSSDAYAFSNAIKQARNAVVGKVIEKMKKIIGEQNEVISE
ncbi:MAG TPA: phosphate acyltransferase PlsX [Bacilli bacterium]|nr:MAG: Phosphate acyltransferase [Tenericutes bacterium ADurb.BinA124]HNZ50077.1 phosphate acyltransferase PlsX [Bacilli bacterium]HPX83944.1 phosphate acyltransferase PlsX [Bacilli bacterium]HQC74495.1 phosphate acyltransferase PlsX [Bacilli bacterium]